MVCKAYVYEKGELTVVVVSRAEVTVTVRPLNTCTVSGDEAELATPDAVCVAVKVCGPLLRLLVPVVVTWTLVPLVTGPVAMGVLPPST